MLQGMGWTKKAKLRDILILLLFLSPGIACVCLLVIAYSLFFITFYPIRYTVDFTELRINGGDYTAIFAVQNTSNDQLNVASVQLRDPETGGLIKNSIFYINKKFLPGETIQVPVPFPPEKRDLEVMWTVCLVDSVPPTCVVVSEKVAVPEG